MLSRFAPDGIVPEEFKLPSFNHVLLQRKDTKMYQVVFISRCSKLFYTISRCYFHIESTFSGASISFVLSHIARYVPSPEENSCIPITHFQCKNNFEHLLTIGFFRTTPKSFSVSHSDDGWPRYAPSAFFFAPCP